MQHFKITESFCHKHCRRATELPISEIHTRSIIMTYFEFFLKQQCKIYFQRCTQYLHRRTVSTVYSFLNFHITHLKFSQKRVSPRAQKPEPSFDFSIILRFEAVSQHVAKISEFIDKFKQRVTRHDLGLDGTSKPFRVNNHTQYFWSCR